MASNAETYLAGVTVVALAVHVILVARKLTHRQDNRDVAARSLWVIDVSIIMLAAAAVTRNTFGLESSAVWLSIAWTVIAATAVARMMGPPKRRLSDSNPKEKKQ